MSQILWLPGENLSCDSCLITEVLASEEENYTLTIVHNNGCFATANLQVRIKPSPKVFIPNAFSPNGDGNNDFFTIFTNEEIEQIDEMLIFDRWGETVFRKNNFAPNNPAIGWDGRFKNELLNPGIFVYVVKLKTVTGEQQLFSGDVALIK